MLGRVDAAVLSQNPDMVIVMVGTNDMLNSNKMLSYDEYKENLTAVVKTIKAGGADEVLMSPPTTDSTYLFQRHERSAFVDAPNAKIEKVSQIMKDLAQQESILFFDLF